MRSIIAVPILIGMIFTMFINGWQLLAGGHDTFLTYINFYNSVTLERYPSYFSVLFYLTGIIQISAALLFVYALIKREFLANKPSLYLKWAILLAIFSVMLFGFMLRFAGNSHGAANLYFYTAMLYFLLAFVEQNSSENTHLLFNRLKILPIYALLFYTMGFAGWQKLVDSSEVIARYVIMFSDTFIAKLPGGTAFFIYMLGSFELIVPVLLIISLVKREFLLEKRPLFLNLALLLSMTLFIMLCFGLTVLLNYPGATNLIFYAILTLGLYAYVSFKDKISA